MNKTTNVLFVYYLVMSNIKNDIILGTTISDRYSLSLSLSLIVLQIKCCTHYVHVESYCSDLKLHVHVNSKEDVNSLQIFFFLNGFCITFTPII
ncbi:hypothetical protein BpHYR1_043665 [Brachionus plicatilis]|uniref:Uncharacterized protein n=1 Tax=Brachionus plicatilis TaxID=10195 RepID=A0A3M7QSW1_BRAPC|nr:hypothetical protein BpHYR1_043665 [Brachionus plicatilis]